MKCAANDRAYTGFIENLLAVHAALDRGALCWHHSLHFQRGAGSWEVEWSPR
jgi:hypothetical protein